MCGRAGWHGAERWQEICETNIPLRRGSCRDFFAMMSRVTFTGLFFFSSPLPPTYLLSGTNLWQRARTVSNCTGLRTINRQDATTYVCE